jgi:gamma-glutamyltranspeptidase/glutathione hydrolase
VSTENPLAAKAGASVLAHGANAADAAVATNAVMGVVEPMMNGIGGDLFAIVYDTETGQLEIGNSHQRLLPLFLEFQRS